MVRGVGFEPTENYHQWKVPEALSIDMERPRLALAFISYFPLK